MSTLKGIGFGGYFFGFAAAVTMVGAAGCASSGGLEGRDALGVAMAQPAPGSVRAGAARVLDSQVNPLVPVVLTTEGGEVAVRFARSRNGGAVVHLDGSSLAPIGPETASPPGRPQAAPAGPARVVLADGRFIVCWKSGDSERGYRLMAQA